jgi:tetratricopeptide (TPR) repeat protein
MKKTTQPAKAVPARSKTAPVAQRASKGVTAEHGPSSSRTRIAAGGAAVPPAVGSQEQTAAFDRAVTMFHKGNWTEARTLFELAASGPVREMAHSARVHLRVCEQRVKPTSAEPATAEDHYNLAVALMNRRELERAEHHLSTAAGLSPVRDHIYYALALTQGLRGDFQRAGDNLRRAIELNPRNRSDARRDPDFAAFIHQPPLAAALREDKEQGG